MILGRIGSSSSIRIGSCRTGAGTCAGKFFSETSSRFMVLGWCDGSLFCLVTVSLRKSPVIKAPWWWGPLRTGFFTKSIVLLFLPWSLSSSVVLWSSITMLMKREMSSCSFIVVCSLLRISEGSSRADCLPVFYFLILCSIFSVSINFFICTRTSSRFSLIAGTWS